MRVGLIFREGNPEIGGGYTFSHQIFKSILNFCSTSSHTFVILTTENHIPSSFFVSSNVPNISLYPTLKTRLKYKFAEYLNAVLKKLRNPRIKFKIEDWYPNFILNSLQSNCIDIIWELGLDSLTMEVPYISTVWDLQHRSQSYFPEVSVKGEWDEREKKFATKFRRSAFIFTGTEVGKAEIEKFYQVPAERIKVLPFPTPQFALDAPLEDGKQIFKKYNLPENYLFYPAQFWSHKNHVGLLLAVKWLKDKYELVFPVVLSGSDKGNKEYIRQTAGELNLSQQVHFIGFVPQEDLISLYRNAFALTFVTFFGPDNLPPLEAFALGCPVVASKVSGAEEQLGDAALLVDPKDPQQIALAIKSLWDNVTLRQTLVQRGLKRATKWTGKDYVKGVFSILDEFAAIRRCWSSTNS